MAVFHILKLYKWYEIVKRIIYIFLFTRLHFFHVSFFQIQIKNSQQRWPIDFCPFYSTESLRTWTFETTVIYSVSFQKLFSLLKYSSFRILESKTTFSHEMRKHKITWEVNTI